MRTRTNGLRRPTVESLESRNLMAGDVMVDVTATGALRILGDEQANAISIEAGENPGEYLITGRPTDDGDTTVNGVASLTVAGVSRGIRVRMGDGNDAVGGAGFGVHGSLGIAMGGGDDSVALNAVHVERSLGVALGDGDDSASLERVRVAGKGAISGGEGSDNVHVAESGFGRKLGIGGGEGNDHLVVEDSATRGLIIASRAGDNTIGVHDTDVRGLVSIFTGAGNDQIRSINTAPNAETETEEANRPTFWEGARIVDHGGENDIRFTNLALGDGGLRMRTGDGDDSVRLRDVHVHGRTSINTAGGADDLAINDSVFGRSFRLQMGDANDLLGIYQSTFRGRAFMAGGEGIDTFFNEDNEFLGPFLENFELPPDDLA